jgi:hypothetical protein
MLLSIARPHGTCCPAFVLVGWQPFRAGAHAIPVQLPFTD